MQYYNLTTPQYNIWNLQKYYGNTSVGNLCGAVFYKETHNTEMLKQAVNKVIQSQTALRLRFVESAGMVKQYVNEYSYVEIAVRNFENTTQFETYASKKVIEIPALIDSSMYNVEIICME